MVERPILFNAAMVRAILAGRKTMTRRIVKPQPILSPEMDSASGYLEFYEGDEVVARTRCPFGAPGDRLWVRETWKTHETKEGWDGVLYEASPGAFQRIEDTREASESWSAQDRAKSAGRNRWRPSIHMPRWASRLTLEVTGVRVERLQDISEVDALAEGVQKANGRDVPAAMGGDVTPWEWPGSDEWHTSPKSAFREGWQTIDGAGAWAANPWLWVVTFKRVDL